MPLLSNANSLPSLLETPGDMIHGPSVTVFIGNIADNVPEPMMNAILSICGQVISWKRVKAFGFCEFSGAEAGLCAINFLQDLQIGDKKLVAKVDAKTKDVLDRYKRLYISCYTLPAA